MIVSRAPYSIPSLITRINNKIIEAPMASSRRGAVVPVSAFGGLIQVL
jgi:hypothetical protein